MFLHGYTGGRFELEPTFKYLKSRYDFEYEFPLYPGHGINLNLNKVTGDEWYQEAEQAFLQLKKRVDTIYIIGYSMGGVFASHLAQLYQVDGLVLIAPAFDHTKINKLRHLHLTRKDVKAHFHLNLIKQVRPRLKHIPLRAMIEFINIVDSKTGDLSKIKCPVKIIQGKMDLLVPYETSIRAHEVIPNSSLDLLENAPHLLMFTREKLLQVNIIIERFIFK